MNGCATRKGLLFVLTLVLAPILTIGCKQALLCPALGSCGGPRDPMTGRSLPPISEWVLAPGHPSCTEDLYVPAADPRLMGGNLPPTGTPFPEPALYDWCVLLVTGPGPGREVQVKPPRFYYESGPIGAANVKYDDTGHFSAGITRTGTFTLDFPAYCVRAFGAMDNKPVDPMDPASPPVNVCKRLEVPLGASGLGEGSYRNTICEINPYDPPGQEGCLCQFDVTETGGPSGAYHIMDDDHTIMHLPGSNFPQEVTFCQEGDRLQLTGADGVYLFDQRGLRTFDLVRKCTDAAQCTSGSCDVAAGTCS